MPLSRCGVDFPLGMVRAEICGKNQDKTKHSLRYQQTIIITFPIAESKIKHRGSKRREKRQNRIITCHIHVALIDYLLFVFVLDSISCRIALVMVAVGHPHLSYSTNPWVVSLYDQMTPIHIKYTY